MNASEQFKNGKLFEDVLFTDFCPFLYYSVIRNYRYFHVLFILFFTKWEHNATLQHQEVELYLSTIILIMEMKI